MHSIVSGLVSTASTIPLASLGAGVGVTPNPSGLPGGAALQSLVGGLLFFALIACLAGLAVSAVAWVLGNKTGSAHVAANGKTGVIIALAGAFIVGAGPHLVDWANAAGGLVA